MQTGLVFNIQKYSVHDGPGIRTTVFLKGCPLRCEWCHNPESIPPRPEIMVVESRCVRCGECQVVCPNSADPSEPRKLPPRSEPCLVCGACAEACPTESRQLVGREMSVGEIVEAVLKDQIFYSPEGGVTFSGGEPLLQPEFLEATLAACKAKGLHTVVDTCGFGRTEHLLAVAPVSDLFLYDIKFIDEEKHRRYTGVSNEIILKNLRQLGQVHDQIWVRVPIIPGFNDDLDELEAIARFVASVQGVRRINLLPFHRTGVQKSQRLGRQTSLTEVQPPSKERMDRAVELFQSVGLTATAGG